MPRIDTGSLLAVSFWLIVLFIVGTNWTGFNALLRTGGSVYATGVRTLQGRG